MDMLRIKTTLMKNIVSLTLSKWIKKKKGYDIKISIEDLDISYDDKDCTAHVMANLKTDKTILNDILVELRE